MYYVPYYLIILSGLMASPSVDVTKFEGPNAKARCAEARISIESTVIPDEEPPPTKIWPKFICKRGGPHK